VIVLLSVVWLLLAWNVIYCILKIKVDFQSDRPAKGILGVFALAGSLAIFAFLALGAAGGM
jgi:hypothetical protein